MFLDCIDSGQPLTERLIAPLRRLLRLPGRTDLMKTLAFRPHLFGTPFRHLTQRVMRGPSEWTVADRELMAAYTSELNMCPFCVESHAAGAAALLENRPLVDAVLKGEGGTMIDPRLGATLMLLEALTRKPDEFSPELVAAARAAGVSEAALEDAIVVCALFNIIVRVANSLGFAVPPTEYLEGQARNMAKRLRAEQNRGKALVFA